MYTDDDVRAFHDAVEDGRFQDVMQMLAKGADVESTDLLLQMRPIHIAADQGHLDIINALIARGCNVNAQATCIILQSTREMDNGVTPLHLAAKRADSNPNAVLALINAGAIVNAKSGSSMTPLHVAVLQGHLSIVKALVSANADVNATNKHKNTPLLSAAMRTFEDLPVAEFLVQNGAVVNARNSVRLTPLHFAAERGYINITKLLVQNKAAINSKDVGGVTPLHMAIQNRQGAVSQFLINNGADVNARDNKKITGTPLHYAAHSGYPAETVRLLIANGASVNARDRTTRTPLYIAAEYDFADIVNILIENKADVNVTAGHKCTPLHRAAARGCLDTVKILIANGAKVDAKTDRHNTPLHGAAYYWHADVVKYLLAKGADVNAPDHINWTPLHFATDESSTQTPLCNSGPLDVRAHGSKLNTVNALIDNGADVNAKGSNDDDTPLHLATRYDDPVIVKCLLENGANYDVKYQRVDNINVAVSEKAAMTRKVNVIALLRSAEKLFQAVKRTKCSEIEKCVKEGAPVNTGSVKHGTPLMYASWKGHLAVVNVLLKTGASVNLSNSNGITALHYAAKFGHHEILCVLLQHGAVYNARTKTGKKTPLQLAQAGGKKEIIDTLKLIERVFIRISEKDDTVLKELHELKDIKCAEFLAVKNCKNVNQETLSQISSKNGYEKLCKLFVDL